MRRIRIIHDAGETQGLCRQSRRHEMLCNNGDELVCPRVVPRSWHGRRRREMTLPGPISILSVFWQTKTHTATHKTPTRSPDALSSSAPHPSSRASQSAWLPTANNHTTSTLTDKTVFVVAVSHPPTGYSLSARAASPGRELHSLFLETFHHP